MDHNTPHIQPATTQLRMPHLLIAALTRVPHPSRRFHRREGWGHRASDPLSLPRRIYLLTLAILLTATLPAKAQWDIQDSRTTASLRGIHNVGGGVAWASGTDGTVLRTEDGGYLWQGCATPPGAEKLDFRGIQAFDENTAIVMSVRQRRPLPPLQNHRRLPHLETPLHQPRQRRLLGHHPVHVSRFGYLLGDPGDGKFVIFRQATHCYVETGNRHWPEIIRRRAEPSLRGNSSLVVVGQSPYFGWRIYRWSLESSGSMQSFGPLFIGRTVTWSRHLYRSELADKSRYLLRGRSSSDCHVWPLSLAPRCSRRRLHKTSRKLRHRSFVLRWRNKLGICSHTTPRLPQRGSLRPHHQNLDHSRPQRHRHLPRRRPQLEPLKPTAAEPQDADKNWNALSLPFVVGPHGRIGKLRDNAIPTAASSKEAKSEK